jgi:hypothetical protein
MCDIADFDAVRVVPLRLAICRNGMQGWCAGLRHRRQVASSSVVRSLAECVDADRGCPRYLAGDESVD